MEEHQIADCPLRKSITILGGKWNLIIIKTLADKELRFGEIKKAIPDITEKMLIEKLKILTSYQLILRKDFKEVPPKVSYQLTEKGLKAYQLTLQIEEFGKNV